MGSSMDDDDQYILMIYEDQAHLVERPDTFASAEAKARNEFTLPANAEVKFAVDWKGRRAEIGQDAFGIVARADELHVTVSHPPRQASRGQATRGRGGGFNPSPLFFTQVSRNVRSNGVVAPYFTQRNEHTCPEAGPMPSVPCPFALSGEIHVKRLNDSCVHLAYIPNDTVCSLKARLEAKTGIPINNQRLIFGGQPLENNRLVVNYGITSGVAIHMRIDTPRVSAPSDIYIKTLTGKTICLEYHSYDTAETLKARLQDREGIPPDQQRLIWCGTELADARDVASYGIHKGDTIDLVLKLRGAKPVIYLQAPRDLDDVSVKLSLVRDWEFSAIYPVVPTKVIGDRSTIEWNVDAHASGELTDKPSGLKLSYLFWEATTVLFRPPTPSDEPIGEAVAFNPANPSLTPANATALPFTPFLKHLDCALTSLGLHVSARTDFVTYWLPHFVQIHERGKNIAFRFLPQAEYEQAARLDVVPAPDVTTRVFMLFGGVDPADRAWADAYAYAQEVDWKQVVGVRDEAWDTAQFRVLEWGGMQVCLA